MRITIVNGFFLPVPPVSGGATEKSWHELARRFAVRGHTVTFLSRRWPGWANDEIIDGVRHLRVPGFNHRPRLWQNLLLDLIWSWRICCALPAADVLVVHAVTLPVWVGLLKPHAGRVVVMTGRMPKGQYRYYRRLARVLAPSTFVAERVVAENEALAEAVRVTGYPIAARRLQRDGEPRGGKAVTVGFVGRFHEEKGLRLLAGALALLGRKPDLPRWRVVLCGPEAVNAGGSGPEFRAAVEATLRAALPADAIEIVPPQFDASALAELYRSIDIFCYPSLAEEGETFGVAVAEAMAAGAVPVVSGLACFADFVRDGTTGAVFDHRAPDAIHRLADRIEALLRDPAGRARLAAAATAEVRRFDFDRYVDDLLADFVRLTAPAIHPSSAP